MSGDFAVIGLGAIGSSLMRGLHHLGCDVAGFDTSAETIAAAHREHYAAQLWHDNQRVSADVVVIAVPVRSSAAIINSLARQRHFRLVTDVGSTKRVVNAAAEAAGLEELFVGGHPLAGTEQSGWEAGDADMFRDKTVYLCPTPHTRTAALEQAHMLWRSLGAQPREITPADHDERIAWLSHLPQLSATALALALRTGQLTRAELGRGGVDMTRLAASDVRLWLDILQSNSDNLDEPLACLIAALADIRSSLHAASEERLGRLLDTANRWST